MSITANSSRQWLEKHSLKVERYLRRYHKKVDRPVVFDLLFNQNPDEGLGLIENFDLTEKEKFEMFLEWIIFQPAVTMAGFGDQRMGKDATMCYIFDNAINYCLENQIPPPRVVTLGNIKAPPFVFCGSNTNLSYMFSHNLVEIIYQDFYLFPPPVNFVNDMYFSFLNIPSGSDKQDVWIYCSEIETVLPAREGASPENRLFSQLAGTLAQNHQKLFGMTKLASRVDINFIRDCNVKFFKYISPDKLNVEGVERDGVLSGLGQWLLPHDVDDKSQVLFSFNNQLFTIHHDLPEWYDTEYSEMYRDIPMGKVWEYVDVVFSNGLDINSIRIAVAQKFRKKLSMSDLADYFGRQTSEKKVSI